MVEENLLSKHFSALADKELKERIAQLSQYQEIPAGQVLLEQGQYVKWLPLVVTGAIKVVREEEQGNELLVYYIREGESCALSMSAYLSQSRSEIKATAIEDTMAILIPTQHIHSWLRLYPSWQEFLIKLYNIRFTEMLDTIEMIAFRQMDERLIRYLKQKRDLAGKNVFQITHQQIATDLGTSREVVSRMLKQLEKRGAIETGRNSLKILGLV